MEAVGDGDEELGGRAAVEGPLEEIEVPAVQRRPRLEGEDRPPPGKTADLQDSSQDILEKGLETVVLINLEQIP